jgi:hypothetical protein
MNEFRIKKHVVKKNDTNEIIETYYTIEKFCGKIFIFWGKEIWVDYLIHVDSCEFYDQYEIIEYENLEEAQNECARLNGIYSSYYEETSII